MVSLIFRGWIQNFWPASPPVPCGSPPPLGLHASTTSYNLLQETLSPKCLVFRMEFFPHHRLHLHFFIPVTFKKLQIFQILDLQTSENAKTGVFFSYKNNFVACKQILFSWTPRTCHELKILYKLTACLLGRGQKLFDSNKKRTEIILYMNKMT